MKTFEFNWTCTECYEVKIKAETAMEAFQKWKDLEDGGELYENASSYDIETNQPHRIVMSLGSAYRFDNVELEGAWQGGVQHEPLDEDDIDYWWNNDVRKEAKEKADAA